MIIFGDTHGDNSEYERVRKTTNHSVHLGDYGAGFVKLPQPDLRHVWIPGNHDNPAIANTAKDCLGYWGFKGDFFFVGGAASLDRDQRVPFVDWWPDEEMSNSEVERCLALYVKVKPHLVLSHDCPYSVMPLQRSRTNMLLQRMWEIYQPARWFYGHHHVSREDRIGNTLFHCVGKMEYVEINT